MEIPHIIFDKGKINIQKDNSVQSPKQPEEVKKVVSSLPSSEDALIDKIRKWTLIGFIVLVVVYGVYRLIRVLFGT